jgi:hypothetical protein
MECPPIKEELVFVDYLFVMNNPILGDRETMFFTDFSSSIHLKSEA